MPKFAATIVNSYEKILPDLREARNLSLVKRKIYFLISNWQIPYLAFPLQTLGIKGFSDAWNYAMIMLFELSPEINEKRRYSKPLYGNVNLHELTYKTFLRLDEVFKKSEDYSRTRKGLSLKNPNSCKRVYNRELERKLSLWL